MEFIDLTSYLLCGVRSYGRERSLFYMTLTQIGTATPSTPCMGTLIPSPRIMYKVTHPSTAGCVWRGKLAEFNATARFWRENRVHLPGIYSRRPPFTVAVARLDLDIGPSRSIDGSHPCSGVASKQRPLVSPPAQRK
jgi:hypothetical protein